MELTTLQQAGHATNFLPRHHALTQPPSTAGLPQEMNLDTLATLVEAVTSGTTEEQRTRGKSAGASAVQLREPAMDEAAAKLVLAGVIITLPNLLAALATARDPVQTEAGTEARISEGVAVQSPPRAAVEGPAATISQVPVTGADTDIADRSANVGAWLKSSPFSNLLALLRQILLKFEKLDRDNSAQMVQIQRDITVIAGEKGVEKAREGLAGALGAAFVTAGVGAASLHQSSKATSMEVGSIKNNLNVANKTKIASETAPGGIRSSGTPSDELRAARNVDGARPAAQKGNERVRADLQADVDADRSAMDAAAKHSSQRASEESAQAGHAEYMAKARIPASHAMMLNMMAPAVGGSVSAGVQIEAEMTEAERQLFLQVADVFRRIADGQQDQSVRSREMRDAAAQLYEALLNLISATSAHIISKS
ncbi:hypothetical protein ACIGHF_11590 [Stenotrophomonas sp. NPDC077464]|uniref:hypothetical protein n=1 Tax=unclassified Stenotrophomonas TaxID=196198 RepID=UPI0037D8E38B